MRKHSYLVVGAGGVGPAIAWWLAQQQDTHHIGIADMDGQRALRAAQKTNFANCDVLIFDIRDESTNLAELFKQFDVVISAIPAEYSPRLAQAALDAKTHFCDLGGVLRISNQIKEDLHGRARSEGIEIRIGNGLMPGLGSMIGQHYLNIFSGADTILIEVCGLAQKPEPPTYHQRTFSIIGMLEIMDQAPILKNGKIREVTPLETIRNIHIPALAQFRNGFKGNVQTCITSGADTAAWWFQKQGVKNFWEETPRYSWNAVRDTIKNIPPDQRVQELEQLLKPTDREHPDLVWMRVTVKKGEHETEIELLDRYDPERDFSAMARTTGFSAATVARCIAQGPIEPGVGGPEEMRPGRIEQCLKDISQYFNLICRRLS